MLRGGHGGAVLENVSLERCHPNKNNKEVREGETSPDRRNSEGKVSQAEVQPGGQDGMRREVGERRRGWIMEDSSATVRILLL